MQFGQNEIEWLMGVKTPKSTQICQQKTQSLTPQKRKAENATFSEWVVTVAVPKDTWLISSVIS